MNNLYATHIFQENPPQIPDGKRVPFSSGYFGLPANGTPARLFFTKNNHLIPDSADIGPARLRLLCAMDVREQRLIEICINGDPTPIGVLDIRFAYIQQPFDLEICKEIAEEILKNGVRIRMTKGKESTFFFFDQTDGNFCPALIFDAIYPDKLDAWRDRLLSTASIQPFGWMEGCVLDGLSTMVQKGDKEALSTIKMHLQKFIIDDSLVYEDPHGYVSDNRIYGIEAGLPFAIMALHNIGEKPLQIFKGYIDSVPFEFIITDSEFISAEGSYTIAYPLALMGRLQNNRMLIDRAVTQLLLRKNVLRDKNDLYLRSKDGDKSYKNWCRAYVWYLLGLVQVLNQIQIYGLSCPSELMNELQVVTDIAVSSLHQGLCHAFLGEPETGIETSGSAGIGAVLALGVQFGLLDREKYEHYIADIKLALQAYLTPDGMLGGVSQSNRDGERLQRSGYRVTSQMGMGLMAHFI